MHPKKCSPCQALASLYAACVSAVVINVTFPAMTASGADAHLVLDVDKPGVVVNPNVYGHFAEHLGRCIYEGIWVGEDSSIPNTRGIRNDVVKALRDLSIPVLRWPDDCFADEYH